jgi:hypothetical protein
MQPSDISIPSQTINRYVRSRHVLIISRIAYSSYLQLIVIRYYLQVGRGLIFGHAVLSEDVTHVIEIKIVYNMSRQTGPASVSRATLLRHT